MILILAFSSERERDKFEEIFERYKRLLMHKAYQILHDYALAEDAASEAFLRVYKNLHKIDDPASPRCASFLVTIVKNVSLTMLDKKAKQAADELDAGQGGDFDLEEHVLSGVAAEEIFALLDDMSEELRGVFLLKYAHGLSNREIGRLLRISENNVMVRLHRARKKLAGTLRREGYAVEQ